MAGWDEIRWGEVRCVKVWHGRAGWNCVGQVGVLECSMAGQCGTWWGVAGQGGIRWAWQGRVQHGAVEWLLSVKSNAETSSPQLLHSHNSTCPTGHPSQLKCKSLLHTVIELDMSSCMKPHHTSFYILSLSRDHQPSHPTHSVPFTFFQGHSDGNAVSPQVLELHLVTLQELKDPAES